MKLDADLTQPERFLHYVILRSLGVHGMARLSLAYDLDRKQLVAVKRLPPDGEPALRQHLLDEIAVHSPLSHPNIAAFHEGQSAGEPFLALRWLAGQSVERFVEQSQKFGQPIEAPAVMELCFQLLAALRYVHAAGYVHGDVAPTNVMIGYDGLVTLLDFGLAVRQGAPSQAGGTPGFVSPLTGPTDARRDLYAVAALAIFMLTGRPPADNVATIAPALATFFARALEPGADNFISASQMQTALTEMVPRPGRAILAAQMSALFPGAARVIEIENASLIEQAEKWVRGEIVALSPPPTLPAPKRATSKRRPGLAIGIGLGTGAAIVIALVAGPCTDQLARRRAAESVPTRVSNRSALHLAPPLLYKQVASPALLGARDAGAALANTQAVAPIRAIRATRSESHDVLPKPSLPRTPPSDALQAQLEEAARLYRLGSRDRADALYNELEASPIARPYALLGHAQSELGFGLYNEAQVHAEAAFALKMGAPALSVKAHAEMRRGNNAAAIADFTRALVLDPDLDDAKEGLRRARRNTGAQP